MNTSNESTPLVIVKMIVSVLVAIIPFFVTWHKCKLESKAADAEHPHRQQSQAVGNIQSIQSNIQINQSIEDNRNQELLAQNEIENQQHESNEMKSGRVFGIAVLIVFAISAIYLISSPANYKINLNPSAFEFKNFSIHMLDDCNFIYFRIYQRNKMESIFCKVYNFANFIIGYCCTVHC